MITRIFGLLLLLLGYCSIPSQAINCADKSPELEQVGDACFLFVKTLVPYSDAKRACEDSGYRLATITTAAVQRAVGDHMGSSTYDFEKAWIGLEEVTTNWQWASNGRTLMTQQCVNDVYVLSESQSSGPGVTASSCRQECINNDKRFAGVYISGGDQVSCRCGSTFEVQEHSKTETSCNMACYADKDQKCGGDMKMVVFDTQGSDLDLWAGSQPNNFDSYQNCMVLNGWEQRTWADEKCSEHERKSHLCEYDTASCSFYTYGNKCYSVHRQSGVSWIKARQDCQSRGGDLITFDSSSLKGFFDDIKKRINDLETREKTHWWIGATRQKWQWNDGAEVTYQNWADLQPSTFGHQCAAINRYTGENPYGWEDLPCTDIGERHEYICEWPTSTSLTPAPTTRTTPARTQPTTRTTPARTQPATRPTPARTPPTVPTPPPTVPTPPPTVPTPPPTVPTPPPTVPPAPTASTKSSSTITAKPEAKTTTTPTPTVPTTRKGTNPNPAPTSGGQPSSSAKPTSKTDAGAVDGQTAEEEEILSKGVIVAIVIAGVAVLVSTIRLIVYCCHRRSTPRRFPKSGHFDNPGFLYDSMKDPGINSSSNNSTMNRDIDNTADVNTLYVDARDHPRDTNTASTSVSYAY